MNNILRIRVVELPPHVLYFMIQKCGDEELQLSLKKHIESIGLSSIRPRNWTNVTDSISRTNLMRLLLDQHTTRPSHVGLEPKPDEKPDTQNKDKRELLQKGIETAKWATKQSQFDLNGCVALALKEVLTSGKVTHLEGLQGIWAEATLAIQKADGSMRTTVRPDITIETPDTLYIIEFNFEKKEVLTRADIARYIMKKVNSYHKLLPIIEQFVKSD